MAKDSRTIYIDGAAIRLKNKRIAFTQVDDRIILEFMFSDSEPNKPAVAHACIRGKVRATKLCLSVDAMQNLVAAYVSYIKHKATLQK